MQKNTKWYLWTNVLLASFWVGLYLYNPLPEDFTDNYTDRMMAYLVETFIRFTYNYPVAMFCSDVYCELNWSRGVVDQGLAITSRLFAWWDTNDLLVQDMLFHSVPVRVYKSNHPQTLLLPAVVFIHGGGFVMGTIDGFDSICRRLARSTESVVISVDYRRAPEHVFPAALDDVEVAISHLLHNAFVQLGVDRTRVAVMGDSAGGGLAAAVTHRLRTRKDLPSLKAQVLLYPLLQMGDLRTPSYMNYRDKLQGYGFLEPRTIALFYLMYAGLDLVQQAHLIDVTLQNAHVSPLDRNTLDVYADFDTLPRHFRSNSSAVSRGVYNEEASQLLVPFVLNPDFAPLMQPELSCLPQALVVTCQHDVLRDEGVLYARRLMDAGVPTTWTHLNTSFHGIINFHAAMSTASDAFDHVSLWITRNL